MQYYAVVGAPVRTCSCGCGETLPPDAHHRRKYINDTHKWRVDKRKQRHPDEDHDLGVSLPPVELDGLRRGPQYEQFVADGWAEGILQRKFTQHEVARRSGFPQPSISRWMVTYKSDRREAGVRETHTLDDETFDDLTKFTEAFFPELKVPAFHREWVDAVESTVSTGRRLLLLAPQRFGKTELLARYCLMRICRDPNIRIVWISRSANKAEEVVGYIKQTLEHNTKLIDAALGAGSFKPARTSGLPWTDSEFTVANRTSTLKGKTMRAIGVGGSLAGLDADLIILDDPQDRKRCLSPAERDKDEEWFTTDFVARKMPQTGVAFIMSRQHMEDLPGVILRDHSRRWEVLTYRAHDPACIKPEEVDGEPNMEHQDCLLWPEMRPWDWLLEQKQSNEDHYERNFQNNPRTDATTYITADEIDKIRDHTRRVGDIPHGCRLIAGIDPAEAKPVAAVLWGWDGFHRHVIDCKEASASVVGLREILTEWPAKYGVRDFAFETNIAKSWLLDTEVKDMIREKNLRIITHYTDRLNKNSQAIGPIAMFQRMRTEPPEITLPGMKGEGYERIERLIRTYLNFDPDWASTKHADDDLVLASWFPQLVIDTWATPPVREMSVDYAPFGGI